MHNEPIVMPGQPARVVCAVGFLAAASFVLMQVGLQMPGAHYLVYEPSDVPALVGTFTMGPMAGLAIVALRNVLRVMVHPDLFGLAINCIASGLYVGAAGVLYRRLHTQTGAVIALAIATAIQAVAMTALNAVLLPLWMGLSGGALTRMLFVFVLPFNLLKGAANGTLTYLLYKRISHFFPRV